VDVAGQAVSDTAHSRNLVSLFDGRSDGVKLGRHTALLNVKVEGDGFNTVVNQSRISHLGHATQSQILKVR